MVGKFSFDDSPTFKTFGGMIHFILGSHPDTLEVDIPTYVLNKIFVEKFHSRNLDFFYPKTIDHIVSGLFLKYPMDGVKWLLSILKSTYKIGIPIGEIFKEYLIFLGEYIDSPKMLVDCIILFLKTQTCYLPSQIISDFSNYYSNFTEQLFFSEVNKRKFEVIENIKGIEEPEEVFCKNIKLSIELYQRESYIFLNFFYSILLAYILNNENYSLVKLWEKLDMYFLKWIQNGEIKKIIFSRNFSREEEEIKKILYSTFHIDIDIDVGLSNETTLIQKVSSWLNPRTILMENTSIFSDLKITGGKEIEVLIEKLERMLYSKQRNLNTLLLDEVVFQHTLLLLRQHRQKEFL